MLLEQTLRRHSAPVRPPTTRTISSDAFLFRHHRYELSTTLHGRCPECKFVHDRVEQTLRPRHYTEIRCRACSHVIFGLGSISYHEARLTTPPRPWACTDGLQVAFCESPRATGFRNAPIGDEVSQAIPANILHDVGHDRYEAGPEQHSPLHTLAAIAHENSDGLPLTNANLARPRKPIDRFRSGVKKVFYLLGYDIHLTIQKRRKEAVLKGKAPQTSPSNAKSPPSNVLSELRMLTPPPDASSPAESGTNPVPLSNIDVAPPTPQSPPKGPGGPFADQNTSEMRRLPQLGKRKAEAEIPTCLCSEDCHCKLGRARRISSGTDRDITTPSSSSEALSLDDGSLPVRGDFARHALGTGFRYRPSNDSLHSRRRDSAQASSSRRSTGMTEVQDGANVLQLDDSMEGSSRDRPVWTNYADGPPWSAQRPSSLWVHASPPSTAMTLPESQRQSDEPLDDLGDVETNHIMEEEETMATRRSDGTDGIS